MGRKTFIRGVVIDLGVMTAIGVVLALIGPFGSFQDPLAIRLMVWVGFAWVGYALYAPIDTMAQRLAPVLDLPEWALRFAGCIVSSVPMSIVVWVLPRLPDRVFWPGASAALQHYLYVLFIGGMITVINTLVRNSNASAPVASSDESAAPVAPASTPAPSQTSVRFLERIPANLGSDILALEMEDHYVRVHTALGSELVLLRLRDAIAELDGIDGMQVHRSWWVARGAVEDVLRDGRNIRLKLARDIEAPVSRANVAMLKEAGWI